MASPGIEPVADSITRTLLLSAPLGQAWNAVTDSRQFSECGIASRPKATESGFDALPARRREEAFRMNSGGWTAHLESPYVFLGEHLR